MICNLIADAGSSKTDWAVTDSNGRVLKHVRTAGWNPALNPDIDVASLFAAVSEALPGDAEVQSIFYYGAGCASPEICGRAADALRHLFHARNVEVASDLLGAARSLLGRNPGVACILGTGSNSCLYDGEKISDNIPSLGYVLGDEGSGTAIGRRLASDAFKRCMPGPLADEFLKETKLTLYTLIEKTYRSPGANRFLASFVPFAKRHENEPYIREVLKDEFGKFIDRNINMYGLGAGAHASFTGGVANAFADILTNTALDYGIIVDKILDAPIDGLVQYHANN